MSRPTRRRPHVPPEELARLIAWLRRHKGRRTYQQLADAAVSPYVISACTLRRAVDGRLATRRTIECFARASGADPEEALRLWSAAVAAVRPRPALSISSRSYSPRRIRTRKGLAEAMRRLRQEAGQPTLRAMQEASEADGRLPRSTLAEVLRGRRVPSRRLLEGFLAACHASPSVVSVLTTAHERITTGQEPGLTHGFHCAALEEAYDRQQQTAEILRRCGLMREDEDWYEYQHRIEAVEFYADSSTEAVAEDWKVEGNSVS